MEWVNIRLKEVEHVVGAERDEVGRKKRKSVVWATCLQPIIGRIQGRHVWFVDGEGWVGKEKFGWYGRLKVNIIETK